MTIPRKAYGETLVELGHENQDIVVLDADVSASTMTGMFAASFPERFFNVGIAEANMMGVAAGLAQSGKIPFASTFAVFATGRAYDQIRQSIVYPGMNVKIVATHGGLTVGPDGASHQSLEDIALMRVLPGMSVVIPADTQETRLAVRAALLHRGPVYIRLGREAVPDVLQGKACFEFGKGSVLYPSLSREELLSPTDKGPGAELGARTGAYSDEGLGVGTDAGWDVALIGCGVMVSACLDAAKVLEQEGRRCTVANFSSVKPLDRDLLLALARSSKIVVTAEEHSIVGGLGSAVCEVLAEEHPIPVYRVGARDCFGESGPAADLLEAYGLTGKCIVEAARRGLQGR